MSPVKKLQQFLAWSYSRLEMYEGCALRAKYKHLDKLYDPASPAMARGTIIHKLCEDYALGKLKTLPKELKCFKEEFKVLRKASKKLQVELEIGMDNKWVDAGWFGPTVWCRVKADLMYDLACGHIRRIIDYKTGKTNPKHADQLSLYAVAAFATAPKGIKKVNTELWYLDQGELVERSYNIEEVPDLKKTWEKRVKKMLADTTFKPTPGDSCRWCAFSKARGGPCKF